tara:strand:+ start:47 stop:1546 length:1500 start_codon:yes stop_codon:yes gene_type:complete
LSISYLTPSFLDILIQEFIKLKKNLTDKKLLDNTTYKKLSILCDKIMASKSFPKADWWTAMFPTEHLGKTPEWAGKNGHRLRIAIHRENGTVMMKQPYNWTRRMVRAFSLMYPRKDPVSGLRKYRVLRFRKASDGMYKYKVVKASPNKPSTPPSTWHTGDKNSATLVRYFPVTRKEGRGKWRKNWGEHDIRFRGHNGRLLRLFYNKKTLEISRMEPDNWSKKQIDAFNYIYPNGHDSLPASTKQKRIRSIVENEPLEWLTKKGAKQLVRRADTRHRDASLGAEQAALIAKLVEAPTGGESKDGAEDPEEAAKISEAKAAAEAAAKAAAKAAEEAKALEEEKEDKSLLDTELKTLLWIQKTVDEDIDNLKQKLAKAEASSKKLKDKIKKKQKELRKEKRMEERRKRMTELAAELERLKRLNEEDEDSSDEELEEIEVDEPDFPGEDEVNDFEHESLNKWEDVDFFKDEDDNVWDAFKDFVGTYDEEDDTIAFKEDYEPEE